MATSYTHVYNVLNFPVGTLPVSRVISEDEVNLLSNRETRVGNVLIYYSILISTIYLPSNTDVHTHFGFTSKCFKCLVEMVGKQFYFGNFSDSNAQLIEAFFLVFSPFLHLLCNFFPIKLNFEMKFCNKSALKILSYIEFLPRLSFEIGSLRFKILLNDRKGWREAL